MTQTTLRDQLAAAIESSDSEANQNSEHEPQHIKAADVHVEPESQESTAVEDGRARDDKGRFAPKDAQQANAEKQPEISAEQQNQVEEPRRPTTWRKEYAPIWDKLNRGETLTPEESKKLAQYSIQRESEFAKGVSTYRAEAQNAKEIVDAVAPFQEMLSQHGIKPGEFIGNLARAHQTLTFGNPQQKLQAFAKLAQDYGVPLNAVVNPAGAPVELMQQVSSLQQQLQQISSWREQQEQQTYQQMISQFYDADKYPHFEAVRPMMAQLLGSGLAQDLETAYQKAVWMNDDIRQQELARQAQTSNQAVEKSMQAAKAKARAVSPRSTTPTASVASAASPKDRRSMLEESFGSLTSRI